MTSHSNRFGPLPGHLPAALLAIGLLGVILLAITVFSGSASATDGQGGTQAKAPDPLDICLEAVMPPMALIEHCSRAINNDRTGLRDMATALNIRGEAFVALNRPVMAQKDFDASLVAMPDYADAWANRAELLARMMVVAEALGAYDKALELDPKMARAWTGRAALLIAERRFGEALDDLDIALTLAPESAAAWYQRGLAAWAMRDWTAAIASMREARALSPEGSPAEAMLREWGEIR